MVGGDVRVLPQVPYLPGAQLHAIHAEDAGHPRASAQLNHALAVSGQADCAGGQLAGGLAGLLFQGG